MRKYNREVTNRKDILSIIHRSDICRIALIDHDKPYIVAMNFGFRDGDPPLIYFHCANEGRKLDIIRQDNNVCFQMDTDHNLIKAELACDYTMKYSSIVGNGRIFIVESEDEAENIATSTEDSFTTDS